MTTTAQMKHELHEAEMRLLDELRRLRRVGRGVGEGPQFELTLGQRIADVVAASMGSWPFIIAQSMLLTVWIVLNITAWIEHWDPYPFILLNLFLSMLAGVQAAALLIAAKRQDAISSELALHDDQLLTKNTDLTADIHDFSREAAVRTELLELLCMKAGIPQDQINAVLAKAGLELADPARKHAPSGGSGNEPTVKS